MKGGWNNWLLNTNHNLKRRHFVTLERLAIHRTKRGFDLKFVSKEIMCTSRDYQGGVGCPLILPTLVGLHSAVQPSTIILDFWTEGVTEVGHHSFSIGFGK